MRGSARARGYTRQWDVFRLAFLREHPLCAMCEAQGRVTAASVVDHIVPHRGDMAIFWREGNHQPLCPPCHNSAKQAEERRGYSDAIGADGWPADPAHPVMRRR